MIEDLSAHFEEANKWNRLSERDKLICRMRAVPHTLAAIQEALEEQGITISVNQIRRIAKENGIDPGRVVSDKVRDINKRRAAERIRATVRDPDAYMARKGVRFEDVQIRESVHG